MRELDPEALHELELAPSPVFRRGVFFPESGYCIDPYNLVRIFANCFIQSGEVLRRTRVERCVIDGRYVRIETGEGESRPQFLVVAAGAQSHTLARMLGSRVPLETQRGYHATLPMPGVTLRLPILFSQQQFIATPMQMGLRLAGTVEFGGLAAPPRQRAKALVSAAQQYIPELSADNPSFWMGHRPCLPDSLPVISTSPYCPAVAYAFGHGHLGLTGGHWPAYC